MEKNKKNIMHLISHVHWDPMWYSTYEEYRIRLIQLMKNLIDILESQKDYQYMFDGQVSAIDDYLEIYPNEEKRIINLVSDGRLIIGPWYIQPEEFMISGECHIRNLMLGRKRGNELGGIMNVSYLCDMVGHISQMPQIIRGFGIDCFVAWRGILNGKDIKESEFIWEGADGSKVLMMVMADSYNSGKYPSSLPEFTDKVDKLSDKLAPYAVTNSILIMQGGDHFEPVAEIPELIKQYNNNSGYEKIIMTSLRDRAEYIKNSDIDLNIHKGEFRNDFLPNCFILTGILSTRMELKLGNEAALTKLERWAEPFSSFASMFDYSYPVEILEYAWKKQIKVAFHDCIYGAHTDTVTPDIIDVYKKVNEISTWLTAEALFSISKSVNTMGKDYNITIFNPSSWKRENAVVEFELFLPIEASIRREFIALSPSGKNLKLKLLSYERITKYSDFSGNMKDCVSRDGILYGFAVALNEIPAMGYENIEIKPIDFLDNAACIEYNNICNSLEIIGDVITADRTCENSKIKITFNDNGTMDMFDKQSNHLYEQMHYFEDSGDAGDNYNFSEPIENKIVISKNCKAEISVLENGKLRAVYEVKINFNLPAKLKDQNRRSVENICNLITSYITVNANSSVIEIKTIFDNKVEDHRLRVVLPTKLKSTHSYAGSQFCVVERPLWKEETQFYVEKRHGNYPHRFFAGISDGKSGVAFLDKGIPEYIATSDGEIGLTLLRCTGYLSKNNLPERIYCDAGPRIATPAAQQKGIFTFEYAIYLHQGKCEEGLTYKYAEHFNMPVKCMQGDAHYGLIPSNMSFIKFYTESTALSAMKKSQDGNGYIIRCYNITGSTQQSGFVFFKPIKKALLTNLNEEVLEELSTDGESVKFTLTPYQIVTIFIKII